MPVTENTNYSKLDKLYKKPEEYWPQFVQKVRVTMFSAEEIVVYLFTKQTREVSDEWRDCRVKTAIIYNLLLAEHQCLDR